MSEYDEREIEEKIAKAVRDFRFITRVASSEPVVPKITMQTEQTELVVRAIDMMERALAHYAQKEKWSSDSLAAIVMRVVAPRGTHKLVATWGAQVTLGEVTSIDMARDMANSDTTFSNGYTSLVRLDPSHTTIQWPYDSSPENAVYIGSRIKPPDHRTDYFMVPIGFGEGE